MASSTGREYVTALAVLAAGAVGTLALPRTTWATGEVPGAFGAEPVRVAGTEVVPIAGAVGWLGLAAVVALIAARGFGRAVVGAVLAVAGLAVVVSAGLDAVDLEAVAVEAATPGDAVPAISGTNPVAAFATAVAGLLVAVAGAAAMVRGSRWPVLGRRYERAGRNDTRTGTDAWSALDRGDDPTTWLHDPPDGRQNEGEAKPN